MYMKMKILNINTYGVGISLSYKKFFSLVVHTATTITNNTTHRQVGTTKGSLELPTQQEKGMLHEYKNNTCVFHIGTTWQAHTTVSSDP